MRSSFPLRSINVWAKHIHALILQILEETLSYFKHHSIEVFKDNMHVKFFQTSALLLQLVVETMINVLIAQKKLLNVAHGWHTDYVANYLQLQARTRSCWQPKEKGGISGLLCPGLNLVLLCLGSSSRASGP